MSNLWSRNSPQNFWMPDFSIPEKYWRAAVQNSISILNLPNDIEIDELLSLTLGEGQFGLKHWDLGLTKRFYYFLKPLLPRSFTRILRRYYSKPLGDNLKLKWPIETRYVMFQWNTMHQILMGMDRKKISFRSFWPYGFRYAFVLTHDIETAAGQAFVHKVADMEESLGFKSSFNFIPERYSLDLGLIKDLKGRGFEVGCHGLKHDGKLFNSRAEFSKRASRINEYLKKYKMVGFRAPLTHRNPEWMQELEVEYDLSFFDTDPFEPISGGTMNIWPFWIGRFVELPYTLVQDYSLTSVLGETSSQIWLEKVDFIEKYHGMALLNSHPDYLKSSRTWKVYFEFLSSMQARGGYWHAIPYEVAIWWKIRTSSTHAEFKQNKGSFTSARLNEGKLVLESAQLD